MLMGGTEYPDSIRDGRRVYVGGELVEDVTTHPAFCNAARTIAMIYDRKRAPENRDVMAFDEDGETFSTYFLLPRATGTIVSVNPRRRAARIHDERIDWSSRGDPVSRGRPRVCLEK